MVHTKRKFKEGDYIVLLSTCNGNNYIWNPSLKVNYCYRLLNYYNNNNNDNRYGFHVYKDLSGNIGNGWTISSIMLDNTTNKLKIRHATPYEIKKYIKNNGPFKINVKKERKYKLKQLYSDKIEIEERKKLNKL